MFVATGSSNGVEPMQRRGSGAAPGGGAAAAGAEQDDAEDLEALDRKQQAVRAACRNAIKIAYAVSSVCQHCQAFEHGHVTGSSCSNNAGTAGSGCSQGGR